MHNAKWIHINWNRIEVDLQSYLSWSHEYFERRQEIKSIVVKFDANWNLCKTVFRKWKCQSSFGGSKVSSLTWSTLVSWIKDRFRREVKSHLLMPTKADETYFRHEIYLPNYNESLLFLCYSVTIYFFQEINYLISVIRN